MRRFKRDAGEGSEVYDNCGLGVGRSVCRALARREMGIFGLREGVVYFAFAPSAAFFAAAASCLSRLMPISDSGTAESRRQWDEPASAS